jgi:hypothetical protein
MKVKVKHSKYGLLYCLDNDTKYSYFPNNITSIAEMKRFFVNGGHSDTRGTFNTPDIVFVNQAGQEAKLYTIKPGEKLAGQRIATVDLDKKYIFDDITTDAEKLEFLRFHLPEDIETEKLESDKDKVTAYFQSADEGTKTAFKQMISDKLTPEVMKDLCEQNAKTYNLAAEIIFEE